MKLKERKLRLLDTNPYTNVYFFLSGGDWDVGGVYTCREELAIDCGDFYKGCFIISCVDKWWGIPDEETLAQRAGWLVDTIRTARVSSRASFKGSVFIAKNPRGGKVLGLELDMRTVPQADVVKISHTLSTLLLLANTPYQKAFSMGLDTNDLLPTNNVSWRKLLDAENKYFSARGARGRRTLNVLADRYSPNVSDNLVSLLCPSPEKLMSVIEADPITGSQSYLGALRRFEREHRRSR